MRYGITPARLGMLACLLLSCGGLGMSAEDDRTTRVHALDPTLPGASGGTFGATRPGAAGGTFGATQPGAAGGTFGATIPCATGGTFTIVPGASGGTFGVRLPTVLLGGGTGGDCAAACGKVVACTTDVSLAQCTTQCAALPSSVVACVAGSRGCRALAACFDTPRPEDGPITTECTRAPTCDSLCCRLVNQCSAGVPVSQCLASCEGNVSEEQRACAAQASDCGGINACFGR
jgi:hypothetical protein